MPEPLRVVVVLPRRMTFSPRGATSIDLVAHDLALFSRHGAATSFIVEDVDEPFADVAVIGFAHLPFEPHALLGRRLGRLARARAAEVVVVHQHLPTAAALARMVAPVPVLLHAHGWPKPPRNDLDRWRRARSYRRMAGVVLVSDVCRAAFREAWGDIVPTHMVPNALDLSAWQPAPERETTIVIAARLSPEKAVLEAVQGLARVLPKRPGWRAVVFGARPDDVPDYTRAVTEAMLVLGERGELRLDRPHVEVQAAFEKAAIALVPSKAVESFGRAALEAFAGGAALAASPVGGLAEVAGDAAVPIEAPTAAAIAAAVERLLTDPALRADLAARGRARAAGYDIRAAAAAYDDLLEQVAGRRPTAVATLRSAV